MLSRRKFLISTGTLLPGSLLGASGLTLETTRAQSDRMKTFSSIGKGTSDLDGHHEATLLDHAGSGCLSHMWFGGDWEGYGKTRIRVYVDHESVASIDMELALGHGDGFGNPGPWGGTRMGKTGNDGGLYNTFRIPFAKHIRITGQRATEGPNASPFWWILRGTEGLRPHLGGVELPSHARLKLHAIPGHDAEPLEELVLCDTNSNGALYQVTIAAHGLNRTEGWHALSFMEGCIRAYQGGSAEPLMLSSGLEDYFLGTYYFQRGTYANDLAGLTHFDASAQTFSAYRFHDEDPLFFTDGLRLTCRCGETEHGTLQGSAYGDPPRTRFRTYAWVYEW